MLLDPRGPRFSAWLTSAVLLAVLLTGSGALALAQTAVFAVGAFSLRYAPYSVVYRWFVARWLGPPSELEPAAPVRFSQVVGFAFTTAAATAYLAGAPVVGAVATTAALAAAFLNAAFGLCLACKVYPFISLYVIRRKPEGVHS
jgi:hypothetical protein